MAPPVHLGFFDRSVPAGSHVCAFYSDSVTRDKIVMPFLAQGLRTGEKCICVLASLGPKEVLARLGHRADIDLSIKSGQLELDGAARREFMRYEARLTKFVAGLPEVILCLYDLRLSGGEVLMDVLRTHPVAVVDGVLHDNPYYVPPDTLLGRTA